MRVMFREGFKRKYLPVSVIYFNNIIGLFQVVDRFVFWIRLERLSVLIPTKLLYKYAQVYHSV